MKPEIGIHLVEVFWRDSWQLMWSSDLRSDGSME